MKKFLTEKIFLIIFTTLLISNLHNIVYAHDNSQTITKIDTNYDIISEEMIEQMQKNDGKISTESKILKHDITTNTTTEVDMEELKRKLSKEGKNNMQSTTSYTPPMYSSYNTKNMNDILTPYVVRDDEPNLDVTKFARVQNAHVSPYVYNCRLIIDGGMKIASGTLVGPNVLLTAAHCVMDPEDPNHFSYQDWRAYPGYDGGAYNNISAGLVSYYYSDDWDKTEETQYDWCICVLDKNIGMQVGFNGCSLYTDTNLNNLSVKEYGYPRSVLDSKYQMYTTGNVKSVYTNYMVNSAICAQGMSGGPIECTLDNRIVGIVSGYKKPNIFVQDYSTYGVRINQYMIDLIINLCK